MIEISLKFEDGSHQVQRCALPFTIGRASECEVRIKHWRVAQRHVRLTQSVDGIFAEDLGSLLGTYVNHKRLAKYGPIQPVDEFIIGPCLVNFQKLEVIHASRLPLPEAPVLSATDLSRSEDRFCIGSNDTHDVFKYIPASLLQSLHQTLRKAFDLRKRDISSESPQSLWLEAQSLLELELEKDSRVADETLRKLCIKHIIDEALGLGVLEDLLKDDEITEIMVNHFDEIFIEKNGTILFHPGRFSSERVLKMIVDRVIAPLGRRVDDASPMVDARLMDGSRLNVVLSPIAVKGISLTIRKFSRQKHTAESLIASHALDATLLEFLLKCVLARLNILIAGGTGSGKTTLLNILANHIALNHRIITIEDSAELHIDHPHVVSLEARPSNIEGFGEISIRDLVRNAMRMRPDRLIVGEVRGAEALDMLMALNTGHDGSFTTLHANSARDSISRLETLVLLAAPSLGVAAIREQIASAFQIIVHQSRREGGTRGVAEVVEIVGMESGTLQLQPYVHYDHKSSEFLYSGLPSTYLQGGQHFKTV